MVYVILADGFEEIEAITPIDLMRRAGLEVKTVGIDKAVATGSHNIPVGTDITLDGVCLENAQMVVLPGGPGHTLLCENGRVTALLKAANANDVPIAAICASPSVIGRLGFLRGKRGTCFPGFEKLCEGMLYTGAPVETDGNYITSRGAGTSFAFALAIIEKLCSKDKADEIKASVQA